MDHALRDLLRLCRRERIQAMLVLLPEGPTFQSWYAPGARVEIDDYLAGLSAELSVPLVDMRSCFPSPRRPSPRVLAARYCRSWQGE